MSEKRSQHGYYSGNFPKFSSIVVVENTRNQLHFLNLKKMDPLHLLNLKKMENFFSYKRRITLPKFSKMLLSHKVSNESTRTICEICPKLTAKTPQGRHC